MELIVDLDDPLKRTFYEIECIRGNWSVRELKRQIGSLYYERSGLSENKEKLAELVQSGTETIELEIDSVQGIFISKLKSTNNLQNKWQPCQIYISESTVEFPYQEEIVLN